MKTIPKKSFGSLKNNCDECNGYRMGERMMHEDWCSQCTTSTTAEKPKPPESNNTLINVVGASPNYNLIETESREDGSYIPKSERLLAIYDMLTDKSFPRKGKGKSTKLKILQAIIEAAQDLRIKIRWDLK